LYWRVTWKIEDKKQEENMKKINCTHEVRIKSGIVSCKDGTYQRMKCKRCASIIKGEKIYNDNEIRESIS